ncbi:hypothetical protein CXB51_025617 [Gossypium anomalum]|uniref:O-methyltransferase domain-containing protein n=1 Tax=Gossypium anomalum TaxID=47600 RepID=A0A8J5YGW8_9ROSI|nr:hypothetical protein CXB51_025617 [Gossypium anomalum]
MGNANGELDNELVQAHAHVWNHVFISSSMSLKCAIDLGIPDVIQNHGKPMTITELVAALPMLNSTKAWAWFQNDDRTPFETAHGKNLWDYCSQDPQLNDLFNESQACDSRLITSFLVDKCKGVFEGLNSLVDVGGGIGIVAKAIADGSKNLKYVGGDMFKEFPTADAILLKRCKEAISSRDNVGGKVIITEMVLREDDDQVFKSSETKLFVDMEMLVLVNGKERLEEEWKKLFLAAGFSYYKITPIVGLKSLIEVYP